jgi:hypothetical protein
MPKNILQDPRYATLRILIDTGRLNTLREILDYIPAEVLATDLNDDAERLVDLFFNLKNITMNEINDLATVIGCDFEKMAMLAARQHIEDMKKPQ